MELIVLGSHTYVTDQLSTRLILATVNPPLGFRDQRKSLESVGGSSGTTRYESRPVAVDFEAIYLTPEYSRIVSKVAVTRR